MYISDASNWNDLQPVSSAPDGGGRGATSDGRGLPRQKHDRFMKHAMERFRERLAAQQATLSALSPLSVLDRGYSLTTKVPEGWIIREAALLAEGDEIDIRLRRGRVRARVEAVRKEESLWPGNDLKRQ